MSWTIATQIGYLLLTVPMALWAATTLSVRRRGRPDGPGGEPDAPAGRLVVAGFGLFALGSVLLLVPTATTTDGVDFVGQLGVRTGTAALVVGIVHVGAAAVVHALRSRPRPASVPPGWGAWPPAGPPAAFPAPPAAGQRPPAGPGPVAPGSGR